MANAVSSLFSDDHYRATDGIDPLLARARAMLTRALDVVMAEYGITYAQGSVLWMLSTGECTTASDLARELQVDAASMTRMLDRLEKRKLAERLLCGSDRRIFQLRLTPAGKLLAEKLPGIYTTVMSRTFSHFDVEEFEQLRRLLNKLLGAGAGSAGFAV